MLSTSKIMSLIAQDKYSTKKRLAAVGQKYYEARHDILDYRVFYIDKNNKLVEDKTRSNIRVPHAFFQEIADQEVAYILSGGICFQSAHQQLQEALTDYFGDDFLGELQEILTDTIVRGCGYVYWYKDAAGQTHYCHADSMGIIEVKDGPDTDAVNDYIIRYYQVEVKDGKRAMRVEVWDKDMTYYYIQAGAALVLDGNVKVNPCPHVLYQVGSDYYYEECDRLPFLRLDHNRQRSSGIKNIKALIDDYDLMDCGLSNNLQDITEGIYVVKGFKGTSVDELVTNIRSRKVVGVSEKGDVDIRTINIPFEARKQKLEIDEKNIYRFSLAFNSAQSGDGNITNIVLKSRYTLLDMKSRKLIIRLKKWLQVLLGIAIGEINGKYHTGYQASDVKIVIEPVVPTDEKEDAEIAQLQAETIRARVGTVLDVATALDADTLLREICRIMELEYEEVSKRVYDQDEIAMLREALDGQVSEAGTAGAPGT